MDTARVAKLWRRYYPERFWVDEELLAFNCEGATVLLDGEGFAIAKFDGSGVVHMSAIGASTFDMFQGLFVALGEIVASPVRWVFGCDRRHFFPGVPTECTALSRWLEKVGFVRGSSVYDVERDLDGYEPPVAPSRLVRTCTDQDAARLSAFLHAEFSDRWHDDSLDKLREDPARIYALEIDDEIEGFAMTQADGDLHRRAGAVWSRSLGPNWAALGPIGVSRAVRGQGHGHALLAAALCSLRDQGARQTIIDWTVLTEFYGKHGFKATREYMTYSREL